MSRLHRRTPNREWEPIREKVFARDGRRCQQCGKAGRLEAHHVLPLKENGSNDMDNLTTLCRGCHIEVHRPPESPRQAAWRAMVDELR